MNNPTKYTPLIITLAYALISCVWILFSDTVLMPHSNAAGGMVGFSILKGILFICVSALILYKFTKRVTLKQLLIEEKLRSHVALYHDLFETNPDALFLIDENSGKILDANRTATDLYGYTKEEFLYLGLADISIDSEVNECASKTKKSHIQTHHHVRKDSTVFAAFVATKQILIDGKSLLMASTRNISNQVEAEKILLAQRNLNVALSRTNDLHKALRMVVASVLHFDGIDIGDIAILEEKSNSVSIVVNEGSAVCEVMNSILGSTCYLGSSPTKALYLESKDIPLEATSTQVGEEIKSCGILPIYQYDQLVAVLFVASYSHDTIPLIISQALEAFVTELGGVLSRISVFDALNEDRKNLQIFFDAIDDYILIKKLDGTIIHANPAVEQNLGFTIQELRAMSPFQLYPPDKREDAYKINNAIVAGTRNSCPLPLVTKSGKQIPVDTRSYVRKWNDSDVIFSVSRDISSRLAMDEKMRHANRLYAFLSHINQAIIRTNDSDQLMQEVVKIANEQGGFLFAWVGIAEKTGAINSVAHASIDANCNPSNPEIVALDSSQGVISNGLHYINNEIIEDPRYQSWFAVISKCNIRSYGSFPIKKHGHTIGTLNLYSSESCFFDLSEVALLEKITESISYALEYLEHEAQRKYAEDKLRASEITYRTIFESVNDAIFVHDKKTGYLLDINRQVLEMFGYTREEMLEDNGSKWHDKIYAGEEPYSYENARALIEEAAKGEPRIFEWLAKRKDGSTFNQEVSLKAASIGGKEVVLAVVRDVTVRVRAKEALQKAIVKVSEEKAKTEAIIAAISDGISVQDNDFRIIYQNLLHKDMVGDHVGTYCYEAYEKRLSPCGDCHHIKTFNDGCVHRRERTTTVDGRPYFYEVTSSPILDVEGNITACLEIVRDVTTHRLAEDKIAESERKFKTLFNHAADAIFIYDLDGKFLDVNHVAVERLGYSPVEFQKMSVKVIESPRFAVKVNERISQLFQKDSLVFETEHVTKDGFNLPVEISAKVINYAGDTCILSIARDITDRKRAEESLRESEEKFRSIFEDSKDMIFICSADGRIEDINPAGIALLSYGSREELVKRNLVNDNIIAYAGDWSKLLKEVKDKGFVKDFEIYLSNRDSLLLTVKLTATAVFDESGQLVSLRGIIRDVTQESIIERQLQQSQKMEAVGQFAGGVAHDFNNVLTAILGYGALLRDKLKFEGSGPLQAFASQIIKSAERASALTNSLLSFSRRQTIKPEICCLNEIIGNTEKLFKRIIREDVEVQVKLSNNLHNIIADVGQMEQVLMNLINNAIDAMPKGGYLEITTESATLDSNYVKAKGYGAPGEYVLLTVSDTGHGMETDILDRIFEPFFTTKAAGKGTGLGMSIVYGIIKQHDGFIDVCSEPRQGTTFKIFLPMVIGNGAVSNEEDHHVIIGGSETILVVEDDPTARLVVVSCLKEYGYHVIESVDGTDAINKFYENQDIIDLLLLDVVMPKMNGKEVYDQILNKRPRMKHLFVSGYTGDILTERGILEEGLNFISKPYSTKVLLQKIRSILDH